MTAGWPQADGRTGGAIAVGQVNLPGQAGPVLGQFLLRFRTGKAMHTIRLRRPWEKQLIGDHRVERVDVPEQSATTPAANQACRYRRRFNAPTGLAPASKVALSIAGWSGQARLLRFNGRPLPMGDPPLRIEISALLQPHNEIEIVLASTDRQDAMLSGAVNLEIESP